jgi:hypothetical protein
MGMLINVVYDEEGNIVALGFPPPPHQGNVQHRSGPEAGPGQTVAQFELPPGATVGHPDLSRLRVDTTAESHKLVIG